MELSNPIIPLWKRGSKEGRPTRFHLILSINHSAKKSFRKSASEIYSYNLYVKYLIRSITNVFVSKNNHKNGENAFRRFRNKFTNWPEWKKVPEPSAMKNWSESWKMRIALYRTDKKKNFFDIRKSRRRFHRRLNDLWTWLYDKYVFNYSHIYINTLRGNIRIRACIESLWICHFATAGIPLQSPGDLSISRIYLYVVL